MDLLSLKIIEAISSFPYPVGTIELHRTLIETGVPVFDHRQLKTALTDLVITKYIYIKDSAYYVSTEKVSELFDEVN